MAEPYTPAQIDHDALRRKIDTIILAICKIKGRPAPDSATLARVASEAMRVLQAEGACHRPEPVDVLVEQIASRLE